MHYLGPYRNFVSVACRGFYKFWSVTRVEGALIRRAIAIAAFLCLHVCWCVPASAQDDPDPVSALGEKRLADAKLFVADGEWDAALVAVQEAGWYLSSGHPLFNDITQVENSANFGKHRESGDIAAETGDYNSAVSSYERALRYKNDAETRTKLTQARAKVSGPAEATGEPAEVAATPEPEDEVAVVEESATDTEPATPGEPEDAADVEPTEDELPAEDGVGDPTEEGSEESPTPVEEPATPEPATAAATDDDGSATAVTPATDTVQTKKTDPGKGFPWLWIVLGFSVVAILVIGTRTPVLAAVAGSLQQMGSEGLALTLFQVVAKRGGSDPSTLRPYVECLISADRVDDESRETYNSAIQSELPADVQVRLATLYWSHKLNDEDARKLYELATQADPANPDLWEALESCVGTHEAEERLRHARRLLSLGRPSPERLLLVAENVDVESGSQEAIDILQAAVQLDLDDEALLRRQEDLAQRLLPIYENESLDNEDANTARLAFLRSVPVVESRRGIPCLGNARRAREVVAELALALRHQDKLESLYDIYLELLNKYPGEMALLDGLLRVSAETDRYERTLMAVDKIYPRGGELEPLLSVQVATSVMVAGQRNLQARVGESGVISAEFPGLTLFELARSHMASMAVDDCRRPDVREALQVFVELYMQSTGHLVPLDGHLAQLLWQVGDYPNAVSLFLWACGFEPHQVDGGVMVLPSDPPPPCRELFPDDRSTMVHVIPDRPPVDRDILRIAARLSKGAMNTKLAMLVCGVPVGREIRQRAYTMSPPLLVARWDELAAAMDEGHPRQTFRKMVEAVVRFNVSPDGPGPDLDEQFIIGRDQQAKELERRLSDRDSSAMLLLKGLRGAGKSTLLHKVLRDLDVPAAAQIRPRGTPDVYVPELWGGLLVDLFDRARANGIVRGSTSFPVAPAFPRISDTAEAYVDGFSEVIDAMNGSIGEGPIVLELDAIETLFPVPDPLSTGMNDLPGTEPLMEAIAEIARSGNVRFVLVSNRPGFSETTLPEGTESFQVGLLDDDSCRALLSRATDRLSVTLEDTLLTSLAAEAGGHPAIVWMLSDALSAARARELTHFGDEHAEPILEQVLHSSAFGRLARNLMTDLDFGQQLVLRALAKTGDGPSDAASVAASVGATVHDKPVDEFLSELVEMTLLEHGGGIEYRIRPGLLNRWLASS